MTLRGPLTGAARALIFVLLLGITAAVAAAQSGFFTLTGRIADEQGRDVSGVKVMLANEVRQAKYEVKTGESGRFEFDRTISRLMEMQSDDYLALGHGAS